MAEYGITFAAGASFGLTTVVVGQPLDTIKTRMQGIPENSKRSMLRVGRDVFAREGVRGLYRGGLPLLLGGSLMRSAQFGVSGKVISVLKARGVPDVKILGLTDVKVVLAGMAGGVGRGLVEAPTDFFKVRRQVEQGWTARQVLGGAGVTLGRNTFLYSAFVVYMDLSKQLCAAGCVPAALTVAGGGSLTPFAKGAICANFAWLTVWPADVVKTQRQSGNYAGVGLQQLLRANVASGALFRGLVPGLSRSTIANGSSMVVYEYVHKALSERYGVGRTDLT